MIKNVLVVLLICIATKVFSQTINRTYQGWWYETNWVYEFKPNGNYKLITKGHYGNTKEKGKYVINGDRIILSSSPGSSEAEHEYFIMDGDSIIIDLFLRFDYALTDNQNSFHNSRLREIKYPQIETNDLQIKRTLDSVLNLALNDPILKAYYHFDQELNRELIIAEYFELCSTLTVDSSIAIFKPKEEIKDEFHIEITDINMNPKNIDISIRIIEESVTFDFFFFKEELVWKYKRPTVREY